MSQAKRGDTVKVHYTGTLEDDTVFDTSRQRDPLEFTLGSGMVVPGFENLVLGMKQGETAKETILARKPTASAGTSCSLRSNEPTFPRTSI